MSTEIAHWLGPSSTNPSGNFDTAANWGPHEVPDGSTITKLLGSSFYTVTSAADNTIGSLVIDDSLLDIASGTFSILRTTGHSIDNGTINIDDGATLKLAGVLVDNSSLRIGSTGDATTLKISGDVVLQGEGEVTMGGSGAQLLSDGSPARLVNFTSLSGDGVIGDADLTLVNRGGIYASDANALTIETTAAVVNDGTMAGEGTGGLFILNNLTNNRSVSANGGNVTIGGALNGDGGAGIANGTLEVGRAVASTQSIRFFGDGVLKLDAAQAFAGTVSTLGTTDAIDLANFAFGKGPTIGSVTSTTVGGISAVEIKITDRALTATIDLLNQLGSTYSTDAGAYQLVSDNNTAGGHNPGTLFQLAASAGA